MVGLIPNILERLIKSVAGPETLVAIRERAGIPTGRTYDMNCVCPDSEWRCLFKATCDVLELTQEQAEEIYANYFLQDALTRWPVWFQISRNSREMLVRQQAIHNTIFTGLLNPEERAAASDKFGFAAGDDDLVTYYRSPNRHCALYIALAKAIAAHYGDEIEIVEEECAKRGSAECKIRIRWLLLK